MTKLRSLLALLACAAPLLFSTRAFADDPETPAPAPTETPPTSTATPAPASTPSDGSDSMTTSKTQPDDAPPDAKDNDLGLEWVWLNADIGFSYADLKSAQLAISPAGGTPITVVDTTSSGLVYGFGAGIRLLFLTIGLRARNHTAMNLWQIDGEVGFHGRMGHFDPYLAARFGYDTVGTLSQSVQVAGSSTAPPSVSVHGWNTGLALGFDYYLIHNLSLGIEGAGDIFFLQRPPATPPALSAEQQAAINNDPAAKANYQKIQDAYSASASSVGYGASLTAHLGIHF